MAVVEEPGSFVAEQDLDSRYTVTVRNRHQPR